MGIVIDKNTKVLVQGITGKEGGRAAQAMIEYHTNVVGGVRPGKGGETVFGRPVFNSVQEAMGHIPGITASAVYVPPGAAKGAILEAIEAGVDIINVMTERIPIQDTAYILAAARERGVTVIGPSSLGCIVPEVGRIGVIGGPLVHDIFTPGNVGIISRSGGMTNEIAWQVRAAGLGQSAAIHTGGDLLMGFDYKDLLFAFETDSSTKVVILFGEHGGVYEFAIADVVKEKKFTKPLCVCIGGRFASALPEGTPIGHAGAIVARGEGVEDKARALEKVGVAVAECLDDLVAFACNHNG
jgi:succinyl-CoA synthetase alpha subunit